MTGDRLHISIKAETCDIRDQHGSVTPGSLSSESKSELVSPTRTHQNPYPQQWVRVQFAEPACWHRVGMFTVNASCLLERNASVIGCSCKSDAEAPSLGNSARLLRRGLRPESWQQHKATRNSVLCSGYVPVDIQNATICTQVQTTI